MSNCDFLRARVCDIREDAEMRLEMQHCYTVPIRCPQALLAGRQPKSAAKSAFRWILAISNQPPHLAATESGAGRMATRASCVASTDHHKARFQHDTEA